MFNPQDDPLGLAVQGRARERRLNYQLSGLAPRTPVGPLPNLAWDGFFQAADEAGRGKPMRFAQDTDSLPFDVGQDSWVEGRQGRMQPMAASNQLGTLSLRSLKRGKQ